MSNGAGIESTSFFGGVVLGSFTDIENLFVYPAAAHRACNGGSVKSADYRSQPRQNQVTSGYPTPVDIWYERGVELGYPRPVTKEDQMDILSLTLTDLMMETGVYYYTKFRRVKTSKGTEF
ncbi:hypothetical protein EDD22DRAFT_1047076 [Suillus occidentalis]|nr:hypothetical protein EDD22DRAFT_1047076 [Suillus occidentalis]